jgi:putative ABC transport system substrate-binding protein
VDRRAFIAGMTGGLLAAPLAVEAQPGGKVPRIGLLTGGSEAGSRTRFEVFRDGLRELGYVDRQTIALEYRYANDNYERLPVLAAELVRLDVSVIVANGTPASVAAKQAASTIFPRRFPGPLARRSARGHLTDALHQETITVP